MERWTTRRRLTALSEPAARVSQSVLLGVICRVIVRNIEAVPLPYTVALFVLGVGWGLFAVKSDSDAAFAEAARSSSGISADVLLCKPYS